MDKGRGRETLLPTLPQAHKHIPAKLAHFYDNNNNKVLFLYTRNLSLNKSNVKKI